MNRKKELLKNTVIISIGKISTQVVSFLLLPLYTAKLSSIEYGNYDFILTIATFCAPFLSLLMEESMFRFIIDCKNEEEKIRIISQTVLFMLTSACVSSVIFIFIIIFFHYKLGIAILFYTLSLLLVALANALLRGLGEITLYSISNFLTSMLIIFFNLVFILIFKLGFEALVISAVFSHVIVSVFIFYKLSIIKYIKISFFDKKQMKQMIKYSLPLVPNALSWNIINISDRLVIMSFLGASYNGLYAISYKFPNVINSFYNYFNIAWKESAVKIINDRNEEELRKIYAMIVKIMCSITCIMIGGIKFVYPLFINNEYSESIKYVPILALSVYYLSIAGFYGGIFTAYKDTKYLGNTSLFAAVINIIINLLFINKIGLYATALSTLLSSLFLYVFRKIAVRKYVKLHINEEFLFIVISIIQLIIFYYGSELVQCITLVLVILLAVILNKQLLKGTVLRILKRLIDKKRIRLK